MVTPAWSVKLDGYATPRSSSGPGRRLLKAVTGVRIPYGELRKRVSHSPQPLEMPQFPGVFLFARAGSMRHAMEALSERSPFRPRCPLVNHRVDIERDKRHVY